MAAKLGLVDDIADRDADALPDSFLGTEAKVGAHTRTHSRYSHTCTHTHYAHTLHTRLVPK